MKASTNLLVHHGSFFLFLNFFLQLINAFLNFEME